MRRGERDVMDSRFALDLEAYGRVAVAVTVAVAVAVAELTGSNVTVVLACRGKPIPTSVVQDAIYGAEIDRTQDCSEPHHDHPQATRQAQRQHRRARRERPLQGQARTQRAGEDRPPTPRRSTQSSA